MNNNSKKKGENYKLSENAMRAIRKNVVRDSINVVEEQMEKWKKQEKPLHKKWLYYAKARERAYEKWYQGFVKHATEKGLILSSHWVNASRKYTEQLLQSDAIVVGILCALDPLCHYLYDMVPWLVEKKIYTGEATNENPLPIAQFVSFLKDILEYDCQCRCIPAAYAQKSLVCSESSERVLEPCTVYVKELATTPAFSDPGNEEDDDGVHYSR